MNNNIVMGVTLSANVNMCPYTVRHGDEVYDCAKAVEAWSVFNRFQERGIEPQIVFTRHIRTETRTYGKRLTEEKRVSMEELERTLTPRQLRAYARA